MKKFAKWNSIRRVKVYDVENENKVHCVIDHPTEFRENEHCYIIRTEDGGKFMFSKPEFTARAFYSI